MGIRGNLNYVLEFATGNESCAELRLKSPRKREAKMSFFMLLASLLTSKCQFQALVTFTLMSPFPCWEERFTDPLHVLVRSKVKPPKLRPKRRKRRRPDAPRGESNTTGDLSTLFKPSVASVDPTLIHKPVLYILFLEE